MRISEHQTWLKKLLLTLNQKNIIEMNYQKHIDRIKNL